ncbi:HD-GYP domain-containing protein [Neobacillus rhizophilus]|uniref:HD-GYP domain-containing protein n=1 Tax=Neobacillus rhizophilus TaxID=2833579 RepID=A0A942U8P7_9BACI|nr:HD-GYP domain-containing protein [Neobacillus rhizophilus]MBS4214607.1 HD-GYP domain-containing protein [Neobacillus rhizophilus]
MLNILDKWSNHYKFYRYAFFIFLLLSLFITIVFHNDNFFILYNISVIFLGFGFYNKPVYLVVFTILVTTSRFQFVPRAEESLFFIYLVSYLFMTFISAAMITYVQRVKQKSLDIITSLVKALDSRDPYTYDHSENVSRYAMQIAEKMNLSKDVCQIIRTGGLLHDIGKIGIPEQILTKPMELTDDEYKIIKSHPVIGYDMLKHVKRFEKNGTLDIVLYHHERFDGNGYPAGLKGNEIPLYARIIAVADTFDAMMSRRVYRNEFDLEHTLHVIRQNKGTQFDPQVVDAFLSLFNKQKMETMKLTTLVKSP